jgi:iron complex outermembrane receptor protein
MLDSALIIGTRATSKTPVTYTNISKDAIKSNNVAAEVPYLMMLTPGVVTSSESGLGLGNTSFRIRGVDPSRINIMVDGIMVNDPESQTVFWANIPDFGSSLGSIQIQRGVGLSSGGVASFGSSVNMLTDRAKSEAYTELSAEYGSYNTMKASAAMGTGLIKNAFTFGARYSKTQSDGYLERATSDNQSVFASAAYHGTKSMVKLNMFYGDQHTGISWNGVPGNMLAINRRYNPAGEYEDNDGITRYYNNETDNYQQSQVNLQYSQYYGKYWSGNIRLFLTRGKGYYEEYKKNRTLSEYGIEDIVIGGETFRKSDLIRQKWLDNYYYGTSINTVYNKESLQLSMGLDIGRFDNDHYGRVLWLRVNNGAFKDHEWYRNTGNKDDYSAFVRVSHRLTGKLNLFGDVQYRHIYYKMKGPDDDLQLLDQSHKFNFFNPKAGVSYKLNKNHEVYASFATVGREPARADYKEASKAGGRKLPKNERLFDYEIGYHYTANNARFSLNFYYMDYKDQIVATGKMNDVGYPIMENVDNSYRAGIELSGGINITEQLKLDANIAFNRSRIKDYVSYMDMHDDATNWNPIEQKAEYLGTVAIGFSPEWVGAALLTYSPLDDLSFGLIGKYVGKQYYDNTVSKERQLDDYFVSNFHAQYSFNIKPVKVTLMGAVNNIFNKKYISSAWIYRSGFASGENDYIEDGFFPQAGTTVFGKIIVHF